MSLLNLFAIAEVIKRFFFTVQRQLLLMHMVEKMFSRGNVVGRMSIQGSVHRGSIRSGEYLSRNCPSGKSFWDMSIGKSQSSKYPNTIYQLNFLRTTALKSSKKEQ